jgi:TraM recognition site of TraD and TraG
MASSGPSRTPAPPARQETGRGVPDGALVGILFFLLAAVFLVWVATGIAGSVQHGSWPEIRFAHTALAIRHLITQPSDIQGAWRRPQPVAGLPTPTAFWTTLFVLVAVLLAVGVLLTVAWTRFRAPVKARRAREAAQAQALAYAQAQAKVAAAGQPAMETTAPSAAPVVPVTAYQQPPAPTPAVPVPAPPPAQPAPGGPAVPVAPVPVPPPPTPPAAAYPHPLSEHALLPRARSIRPEIPVIGRSLHDVLAYAIRLGRDESDGTELYGGLDHGFCVYGPPGSGKTSRLVHAAVATAPGPVLVTCDGPRTLQATLRAREKTGPVSVFDPLQLTEAAQRLRWSPVHGCEDPATADSRARALLEPVRPLARTLVADTNTQQTAQTLLRCWLHAAALDGRPIRQVHRWAGGQAARDAVKVLRTAKDAAADWAGSLEATLSGHPQQLEAARALVVRALDCLSPLHVLNSCTPSGGSDQLNVESLLHERGTLYVVGEAVEDPRSRPGAMPLLTALIENVVELGRRVAARSSSGRLDPPLLCALDDVATLAPAPGLPELMAVGGRTGLPTLAVFRSREQARHRWGDRGAATIDQSANLRIDMDATGRARIEMDGQAAPVVSKL